ncbi:MAG: AraC family transcriptional regulator [Sphingomonadales bacterium]|nr:AraC family transcriptional regulator [Sphingomonadales bacterium]
MAWWPPARSTRPRWPCPTGAVGLLWQLAAEQSGNPYIGVSPRPAFRPSGFGVVGYAMMSCPNLLAAFRRAIHYLQILSEVVEADLAEDEQGYRLSFLAGGITDPRQRQRVEYACISLLDFCRWASDRPFNPMAVDLPYPAPTDALPYQQGFGCLPRFDQPACLLRFIRQDLLAPLVTSNSELAVLHERYAEAYLHRLQMAQATRDVHRYVHHPPSGRRRPGLVSDVCRSPESFMLGSGDPRDEEAYRGFQARDGADCTDQRPTA